MEHCLFILRSSQRMIHRGALLTSFYLFSCRYVYCSNFTASRLAALSGRMLFVTAQFNTNYLVTYCNIILILAAYLRQSYK